MCMWIYGNVKQFLLVLSIKNKHSTQGILFDHSVAKYRHRGRFMISVSENNCHPPIDEREKNPCLCPIFVFIEQS